MKVTAVELARLLGQAHPPTPEQAAVIESPLEPLLVVAGAGSGKTETMAARVVYLVANGLVRPDQILGLTFTRKAAGQLSDRIRTRLGTLGRSAGVDPATREMIQGVEPVVSTYHAFGGRVISEYGPLVGVDSGARVLTPTAAWRLARSVVQRWDGDLDTDLSPDQVTSRVLDVASSLSDHLRTVDELSETLLDVLAQIRDAPPAARQRGDLHSTLATPVRRLTDRLAILPLVRAFSQQKLRDGTIDFGDQMMLAATLARNHPRVGENLRDRFRVVLLDEYQDTGHAQRVLLSQLFGAGSTGRGHPVTAVGDPVQSIYSWRGASASNLPHFVTDFPRRRGGPAARSDLLTSFRNPVSVLAVANRISEPVRAAPVRVATLAPRPGAAAGRVRYGLFHTVEDEDAFIAAEIAGAWKQAAEDGRPAPTTAVLLRRRADMAPVAELLRSHGLPVEVSGLGGLLAEPEIVDLVSALRVLVDPGAGDAAVRLLTGARWNLGLADLAALHRRARLLAVSASAAAPTDSGLASVRSAMAEAGSGEDITSASLVDAIADPGEPGDYSEEGYRRVQALEAELRRLRQRVDHPLPELVADIERTLGLDVEVLLADGPGRAHLDAFADEVAEFAGGAGSTGPADLLDYLQVAVAAEKGLAPGEVQQVEGAVQILTVHAAKGLEWELVAVPHLADKVFPGGKGTTWLTDDEQLPPSLRGDVDDIPGLRLDPGMDQKEIGTAIEAHRSDWSAAGLAEERRLLYVAVTRAEEELIFGSHYFTGSASKARGPSAFFLELAAAASSIAEPSMWVEAPGPEETNPLLTRPRTATWPIDALGARRAQVLAGAAAVGERLSEHRRNGSPDAGVVTDHGDAVGALDDAALDDAALDDSAQDDAALDNAALDDSALDDSA
ncbi:ATP-dependent helicase, partial [Nakamurella silvestris]